MNRGERREISKRKWISRAKKIYNSLCYIEVPIKGIKAYSCIGIDMRVCDSITDFLTNNKFAKSLKNGGSPYKNIWDKIDDKIQNRKERYSAKNKIKEGIEEYEHLNDPECFICIHYESCEKAINGNTCPMTSK